MIASKTLIKTPTKKKTKKTKKTNGYQELNEYRTHIKHYYA